MEKSTTTTAELAYVLDSVRQVQACPYALTGTVARVVLVVEYAHTPSPTDLEELLDKARECGRIVAATLYRHAPTTENLL